MKFISALVAALLVLAPVAQAKPKAKVEPKEAFTCAITDLKIIGEPDARGWERFNALVRMNCKNAGSKPVRIERSHVFLEDEEYETDPSGNIDVFNSYYGTTPGIMFFRRYVDVAPGKAADFALYFKDVRSRWGVGLVLDINGKKYPLPVLPH